MNREPLLLPFLALAGGVTVAQLNYFQIHELYLPFFAGLFLCIASTAVPKARRMRYPCFLLVLVIAGTAIQVSHRQVHRPTLSVADGEFTILEGCVINPPVFEADRAVFVLALTPRRYVRISVNRGDGRPLLLRYGQKAEVTAKVRTPHKFLNPGEFDYPGWLAAQNIYWTATASTPADIEVVNGQCGGHWWQAGAFAARDWAMRRLDELYRNDQEASSLLKAVLLGQTAGLERQWTSDFRLTGTYHALVISGQHVAVLAAALLSLLRLLQLPRVPSLLSVTVVCWFYALVTGLSAPVVRAAGGFTLMMGAGYLFRRVQIVNALSAVGIVYLVCQPDELFDPSFLLSFLSVGALALFALPLVERWTGPLRAAAGSMQRTVGNLQQDGRVSTLRVELRLFAETVAAWLRCSPGVAEAAVGFAARLGAVAIELALISAVIQFALVVPMISYFHRVSITGIPANLLIAPLFSLLVPSGFFSILTNCSSCAMVTAAMLHAAQNLARWYSSFEPSWRFAGVPAALGVVIFCVMAGLAVCLRTKHRFTPLAATAAAALTLVIFLQPWTPQIRKGWLEVSAIDVGQGDSIFTAMPDGTLLLIDAGGFPGYGNMKRRPNLDIGEDVVSPYLWSRSIKHLDYVALTHGHSDHMQGMCSIIHNFRPRELWIGPEPESPLWLSTRRCASESGVKIRTLSSETPVQHFGAACLKVLAPPADYEPGAVPNNNDSLVFSIQFGQKNILLTGDAERPMENRLLSGGSLRPATLIKIGHHGSRTSSSEEFLERVKPVFALISAGYLNQFHHPHPDVLTRLADRHAMVLRTDQRGLSTFVTDGKHVEVTSFQ